MEKTIKFSGLHNLVAPKGARKAPKRLGRGESSGHGKTSGRGHKGQKARKSGNVRIGFEGGQNPLTRRLPKKGFTSLRERFSAINLYHISERFNEKTPINPETLVASGLLQNLASKVKILGVGEAKTNMVFRVHAISGSARSKIEKAGGSIEIIK